MWFARPRSLDDLQLISSPAVIPLPEVYRLLTTDAAEELRHKVGVVGRADGSAKGSTRLLLAEGWLFKTDEKLRSPHVDALIDSIRRQTELGKRLPLWHPRKFWFVLRTPEGDWLPVSGCPELVTLRSATDWSAMTHAWNQMLRFGIHVSQEHQVGLDMNPANFGADRNIAQRLFYLDDETYPPLHRHDIAQVIIARIPEEPHIPAPQWEQWGQQLQGILVSCCQEMEHWLELLDGLKTYPLAERFDAQRNGLIQGIIHQHPLLDPNVRRQRRAEGHAPLFVQPEVPQPLLNADLTFADASAPPQPPADEAGFQPEPERAGTDRPWPMPTWSSTTPQRTCIFSDVHGNLPALRAVLRAARELGADSYLFLGDVIGYGPFPKQCIEVLAHLPNAILLRGNHDQIIADRASDETFNRYARAAAEWTQQQLSDYDRAWLKALPLEYRGENWLALHGAPIDPERLYAYVYEMTYEENLSILEQMEMPVCFHGHTHVRIVHRRRKQLDEKVKQPSITLFEPATYLLINPGSVGQPRDNDPKAAFALWEHATQQVHFHRVEYAIGEIAEAIRQAGLPSDLIGRLEVGR